MKERWERYARNWMCRRLGCGLRSCDKQHSMGKPGIRVLDSGSAGRAGCPLIAGGLCH